MVNPVLTIAFDIFLIGSGAAVVAGMVAEHRASRQMAVGGARRTPLHSRPAVRRTNYRRSAGSRQPSAFRRRLAA